MLNPGSDLLRTSPGDPAAAFVDVQPPNLDKSSAIVFEKSASWIANCLNGHKQCNSAEVVGVPLLPTRVIDVGDNDPASIAKIHVSAEGERGRLDFDNSIVIDNDR
jgi:hypothetical protein